MNLVVSVRRRHCRAEVFVRTLRVPLLPREFCELDESASVRTAEHCFGRQNPIKIPSGFNVTSEAP